MRVQGVHKGSFFPLLAHFSPSCVPKFHLALLLLSPATHAIIIHTNLDQETL